MNTNIDIAKISLFLLSRTAIGTGKPAKIYRFSAVVLTINEVLSQSVQAVCAQRDIYNYYAYILAI